MVPHTSQMAIIKKSTNNKCWKGVEKRETSFTVSGNVNWYNHYGEWYRLSLKDQSRVTTDPVILLLGIYLEKNIIPKDTCTPMFIAALFVLARTWKQSKYPPTYEWIKKMWYILICTMEYYWLIKKWNNAIFSNLDGSGYYHTKWSKSDRERQMSYDNTFIWKNDTNEVIYETVRDSWLCS